MKLSYLALFIFQFAVIAQRCAAQQPVFAQGDSVVFTGNSITMNGEFHHQIALFYATRFPDQKINVFNSGIGGNASADILRRMSYDVLNHRPSWTVLMLGMNDVNRDLYMPGRVKDAEVRKGEKRQIAIYKKNVLRIIDTLLSVNSRIILQTPTIYDQTAVLPALNLKGRNDLLGVYSKFVKRTARRYALQVIDYRTILTQVNKRMQKADRSSTIIGADRVHPGPAGHFVMAYQFLKAINASRYVSKLTADARSGRVTAANADVRPLNPDRGEVHFASLERSLPFPVSNAVSPALRYVPFTKDFNQQIVKIRHLEKGNYRLLIDSVLIGKFPSDSLSKGINLALYPATPQYRQALEVLALYQEYWKAEAELRSMISMEYNQLRLRRPVTLAEGKLRYAELLAQPATDANAYRTLKNLQESYLRLKAREPELVSRLKTHRNLIYDSNHPSWHVYHIVRE